MLDFDAVLLSTSIPAGNSVVIPKCTKHKFIFIVKDQFSQNIIDINLNCAMDSKSPLVAPDMLLTLNHQTIGFKDFVSMRPLYVNIEICYSLYRKLHLHIVYLEEKKTII